MYMNIYFSLSLSLYIYIYIHNCIHSDCDRALPRSSSWEQSWEQAGCMADRIRRPQGGVPSRGGKPRSRGLQQRRGPSSQSSRA